MTAYNKKIRIYRSTEQQDRIGNTEIVWSEIFHGWASVNCTGGDKYYAAAQTNTQNHMFFTIRYCKAVGEMRILSDTEPEYRIQYNNRMYEVKHIDDYMESHRELRIRAEEVRA